MRLFLGVCLIFGCFSINSNTGSAHRNSTEPKPKYAVGTVQLREASLLIRRLRKGKLRAGGLALITQLDERSLSEEPELDLVSAPGLRVQTDYSFNLDAPTNEVLKAHWSYDPGKFEFALKWMSQYHELLYGPEGHVRVKVEETFFAYRVKQPSATRQWSCSYVLDREIAKEQEQEVKRLNETVVAPARGEILQEIRAFVAESSTRRKK